MDSSSIPIGRPKVEHTDSGSGVPKMNKQTIFLALALIFSLFVFFYFSFLSAPADFPIGAVVKIEKGDNLRKVSLQLQKKHIIRSRVAFEALVIIYGGEKHIVYSDYLFASKLSVFEVARRIIKGEHHMAPVVVTIPEGFNVLQIADSFASKLSNFDKSKFLIGAKPLEGSLFPDTYFFSTTADEEEVLSSIIENFDKKIKLIRPEIVSVGRIEKEIIIMASIVEREAKGDADREIISGILWRRLAAGMPLQVDAAPDTYKTKGLPKIPIGNPGLEALKAAIHPQSSPYLYYLHDKNGMVHYARNLSDHNKNINTFLK